MVGWWERRSNCPCIRYSYTEDSTVVPKTSGTSVKPWNLEADLAALHDKAGLPRSGLPRFGRSKPLTEWLTILDISKELIERVRVCLDVEAIREGREPPKRAKALLAERDSAEQSALAQLAAIGGFFPGGRSRGGS